MKIRLEPVIVEGVEDGEGVLAFWDDRLVAVLVRLGPDHDDAGLWFVEKGFGVLDRPLHPVLADLDEAAEWLKSELADRTGGPARASS